MSTTSAVLAPAKITSALVSKTQKKVNKVVYLSGLNCYGGLKPQNKVVSLGQPACTEQCFANFASSANLSHGKGRGRGALSATCNAASEIFRIAAIMNGLVLVRVAVGFVLLRVGASSEEAE